MSDMNQWVEETNSKLLDIHKDLSELVILADAAGEYGCHGENVNLLELLEFMNKIQEDYRSVVTNIKTIQEDAVEKKSDINIQFESLQKSMELLRVEVSRCESTQSCASPANRN